MSSRFDSPYLLYGNNAGSVCYSNATCNATDLCCAYYSLFIDHKPGEGICTEIKKLSKADFVMSNNKSPNTCMCA